MVLVRVTVLNDTFNNISVLSWQWVLLMEKTRVPGENYWPVTDKFYHTMLYRVHFAWARFELTTLVVIGTCCIGSYEPNYHTIMTTTVPGINQYLQREDIYYILTSTYYVVINCYIQDVFNLIFLCICAWLHFYIKNNLKFAVNFLSCMNMCGASLTTIVNCIFNYQTIHIQIS